MSVSIKLDGNANIIVGSDTASTTAKQFLLFLLATLQGTQDGGWTLDPSGDITALAYDPDTHLLSWTEWGNPQTYSMTTSDLQAYTTSCVEQIEDVQYADKNDVQTILNAIAGTTHPTDLADLAHRSDLESVAKTTDLAGLATTLDLAPLAHTSDLSNLATQADLQGVVRTADLEPIARASDLESLATRADLDGLAHGTDLDGLAKSSELGDLAHKSDLKPSTLAKVAVGLSAVNTLVSAASLADRGNKPFPDGNNKETQPRISQREELI